MFKNKKISGFLAPGDRGIALLTVLMVIVILMLLATIAIETTGSDILNAGNYTSLTQTISYSNSAMNLVTSQINTYQGTNAGIGLPTAGVYYYTSGNSSTLLQSSSYVDLALSNINSTFSGLLNTSFSSMPNSQAGIGNFGFEYYGNYGPVAGYSLNYKFFSGQIYSISSNESGSQVVKSGMTFNYGPLQVGYNQ